MEWRVTKTHDQALKRHGVNMYQAMSLIYIARYGRKESVNQRSIEHYLYLSNPGVSKIVGFLEQKGYIVRDPDPKDARSYLLTATKQGEIFAEQLNQAILTADEEIVAPLNGEERRTMLAILAKINGRSPGES